VNHRPGFENAVIRNTTAPDAVSSSAKRSSDAGARTSLHLSRQERVGGTGEDFRTVPDDTLHPDVVVAVGHRSAGGADLGVRERQVHTANVDGNRVFGVAR
jgi:hypothetical protein